MTTQTNHQIDIWLQRIGAASAVVLTCLIPLGSMWIKNHLDGFATEASVDAVQVDLASYKREQAAIQRGIESSLATISTTLAVLNEKMGNDARQDRRLESVETRVLELEKNER